MKGNMTVSSKVNFLRQGCWPLSTVLPTVQILIELEQVVQAHESFYAEKCTARKLTWNHSVSTVDLQLHHTKKPYTCALSSLHMGILVCFNDQVIVTASEYRIQQAYHWILSWTTYKLWLQFGPSECQFIAMRMTLNFIAHLHLE